MAILWYDERVAVANVREEGEIPRFRRENGSLSLTGAAIVGEVKSKREVICFREST